MTTQIRSCPVWHGGRVHPRPEPEPHQVPITCGECTPKLEGAPPIDHTVNKPWRHGALGYENIELTADDGKRHILPAEEVVWAAFNGRPPEGRRVSFLDRNRQTDGSTIWCSCHPRRRSCLTRRTSGACPLRRDPTTRAAPRPDLSRQRAC